MRSGKMGRSGRGAGERRFRSLDATGNVRVLTQEDITELAADLAELGNSPGHASRRVPLLPQQAIRSHRPAADPPIPGYESLSAAALRPRLRGLDAAALRHLIEHEKSNRGRRDIIAMLERRISRLETAASDAT